MPKTFLRVVAANRRVEWLTKKKRKKKMAVTAVAFDIPLETLSPVVLNVVGGHGGVGHPVVDDSVHTDCDRVSRKDLLRRHVEGHGPEVHLLEGVHTRHDEEEAGALGATGAEPAQPEHNGSLEFLDHLQKKPKEQ